MYGLLYTYSTLNFLEKTLFVGDIYCCYFEGPCPILWWVALIGESWLLLLFNLGDSIFRRVVLVWEDEDLIIAHTLVGTNFGLYRHY